MRKTEFLLTELGEIADRKLREEEEAGQKRGKQALSAEVPGISTPTGRTRKGKRAGATEEDGRMAEIRKKISSGFYTSTEALRKIADKMVDDVSEDETNNELGG